MKVVHKITGHIVSDPINNSELEIEIDHTGEDNTQTVTVTNFIFGVNDKRDATDGYVKVLAYKEDGLIAGAGVTEGLAYTIDLDDERGTVTNIFNGFLDIGRAEFDRPELGQISAPAVEVANIDWLNTIADSFSFEFLFDKGEITKNDFIAIPYCLNKKQNAYEIVLATATIFTISLELEKVSVEIGGIVAEIANGVTSAAAIIKLSLLVVYISTLIVAIIKLLTDLYNSLVQPVKYHYGMNVKLTIERACNHLGLTFNSSILSNSIWKNLVILPEKYNIKESNTGVLKNIVGYFAPNNNEQVGYFKGTFGDLLRALKQMFKAKINIQNGVLYFEKFDFKLNSPLYIIPDQEYSGYTLNIDQLKSNYYIKFTPDFEDRNTIQEYQGTAYQVITQQKTVINKRMLLMKDFEENIIPFARGIRKTKLNAIEEILSDAINAYKKVVSALAVKVNAIIAQINNIIKQVNKIIKILATLGIKLGITIPSIKPVTWGNFINPIENRLDMLMMESDYVATPKLLLIADHSDKRLNKLEPGNETYINAKYLYDNYHYFTNFVPSQSKPNGYQYLLKKVTKIPFTFDDYMKVRNNNFCFDSQGNECLIDKVKFNPIEQVADIDYRVNKLYTNNLQNKYLYPDGR